MNVFLRLITYIRPYLGRVCIGISATLVIIGLDAAQPLLMREVIDNILTPYFTEGNYIGGDFADTKIAADFDRLQFYALILLGIYILHTIFSFINRYLLNRTGQDILFSLRVIKCFAREGHELSRFTQKCKAFLTISITIIKTRVAFFPLARFIISMGPLLVLLFGGRQIISGDLTIGTLFAFQSFLWRFYGPVESLTRINDTIVRAAKSAWSYKNPSYSTEPSATTSLMENSTPPKPTSSTPP